MLLGFIYCREIKSEAEQHFYSDIKKQNFAVHRYIINSKANIINH